MTSVLLVQEGTAPILPARLAPCPAHPDGLEVTQVPSLAVAVERLRESLFDAALVDLACPDANGVKAIASLHRVAPRLPVVVMVEPKHRGMGRRALSHGARDYVIKRGRSVDLISRVLRHAIEIERAEEARRRVVEALRVSTARSYSLFENEVVGMAFATLGGWFTEVNTALRDLLGYSETELLSTSILALGDPADSEADWSFLARLKQGSLRTIEIERRFLHRQGHTLWGLANISSVRDGHGQPLQLVFKLRDISERKRAEERLRESREESRLILETANDGFIAMDPQGKIRDWNSRAAVMFGWSREEVIGRSLAETIIPACLRNAHHRGLEHYLNTGQSRLLNHQIETTALHRDGHQFPVELTLWATSTGPAPRFNAFVRDISDRFTAEKALRESEERFRAIFEGSSLGIAIADAEGRIIVSNPTLHRILGYSGDELVGKTYTDLVHPEPGAFERDQRRQMLSGERDAYELEQRYRRKDGRPVWLRLTTSLVRDNHGDLQFVVAMIEDLTERHLAESALRERAMELVELVTAAASEASTAEEVFQICLDHVCNRTGWPVGHVYVATETDPPELIPTEIWHLDDPERFRIFKETTMSMRFGSQQGLPGRVFASAKPLWVVDLSKQPLLGRTNAATSANIRGAFACPLIVGNDVIGVLEFFSAQVMEADPVLENAAVQIGHQLGRVIERKRVDSLRAHQALHDPLTDLPNRLLFVDRVGHALARLGRSSGSVALLFLDLDGFKEINDNFGHDVGDHVLVALTQRIRNLVRPEDTVARFGGDELTILCEDLDGEDQAMAIAQRLLEIFDEPLPIDGLKLVVSASIGIAMASGSSERPEALLRNADTAMYRAKERGGQCYQLFNESLRKRQVLRRSLEWSLRQAIDARQLRVHYQPCLDLRDGSVVGIEALVRWQHPDRGLLGPEHFIPFAEECGLVIPIGHWVIEEACRQSARWRSQYRDGRPPCLWVNLSSRQLDAPDLVERVSRVLEAAAMKPYDFGLEITETVLLDNEAAIGELRKLQELGVALSIDDFGTGYSSLSCIKRLPVTQIKIDRSFVAGVGEIPEDAAIVSGMIDMGHALGLIVVAEGVETAAQLEKLKSIECDRAQGFYFASPVPGDQVAGLIAKLSTAEASSRLSA